MVVRYIYRTPSYGFSIERVFEDIRGALPKEWKQSQFFCPTRQLTLPGLWRNLRAVRRQPAQINHITGDVYYLATALPKKTLILTIHDSGHIPNLRGFKRSLYRLFWFSIPVKRAAIVAFISDYSKRELEGHLGREIKNACIIPDPVSAKFHYHPKSFNQDCPRILALGTKVNKNLLRLAEALKGLKVHLRVIGPISPEQHGAFKKQSINYSNAKNLSFDEIVEEYRQADIVSLVSTHEGFGLPIVEGQATGRVVVAGNVCSMPEVAGAAAVLVNPYEVASIRGGFERVLKEPELREAMIAEGLENAQRFHPEMVAAQYAKIYTSLLEK